VALSNPTPIELNVFEKVIEEVRKAEDKHPVWPRDPMRQAAVVAEEAGELLRAVLTQIEECEKPRMSVREFISLNHDIEKEALQTAAMAIRFLVEREKLNKHLQQQAHLVESQMEENS